MPLGRHAQGPAVKGRQFAAAGVADAADRDGRPLQRAETGVDGVDPVLDAGGARSVQSQSGGAGTVLPAREIEDVDVDLVRDEGGHGVGSLFGGEQTELQAAAHVRRLLVS